MRAVVVLVSVGDRARSPNKSDIFNRPAGDSRQADQPPVRLRICSWIAPLVQARCAIFLRVAIDIGLER